MIPRAALAVLVALLPASALAAGASDALSVLCPRQQAVAGAVDAASVLSGIASLVLAAQFRAETSCDPWAVNRKTGARGPMQILPGRSADPDHLESAELDDPGVNFRLGALHLRKMIRLCGTLGGALSLYHGNGGAYHGRRRCDVDDWARKVLDLVSWARRKVARLREARS